MIAANELRIGNWVTSNKPIGYLSKKVTQVTDIDSFRGINSWQDMGASGVTAFEDLQGVPLTEEWLVTFGFQGELHNRIALNSTTTLYVNNDVDNYIVHVADEGSGGVRLRDIKYVHELQNLFFALSGEELKQIA